MNRIQKWFVKRLGGYTEQFVIKNEIKTLKTVTIGAKVFVEDFFVDNREEVVKRRLSEKIAEKIVESNLITIVTTPIPNDMKIMYDMLLEVVDRDGEQEAGKWLN